MSLVSVESFDEKYKYDVVCHCKIEEVKVNYRVVNRLVVYEVKKADFVKAKSSAKGKVLGYVHHYDVFNQFKRKKRGMEFVFGERSFDSKKFSIGGKIVFEKEFVPKELVVFIQTRGQKMKEAKIPFPMKALNNVKGSKINFEKAKEDFPGLVASIKFNDAFYGDMVLYAHVEDGKYSSPVTRKFIESKRLLLKETYLHQFGKKTARPRSLGAVFNILLNKEILLSKEKGQAEVKLGEFKHQGYVIGGKFSFGKDYGKKELILYAKPRGANDKMIVKKCPFPLEKMQIPDKSPSIETRMKKVKDLLGYIVGYDALFFEKIIYAVVTNGKISQAGSRGFVPDKLITVFCCNKWEIGVKPGVRLGQIHSLRIPEKIIQLKKGFSKTKKDWITIGEFTDTSKKQPCIWGCKVSLKDWKPSKIVLYHQGRGKIEKMREEKIDFSKFPSTAKF